ncbi:MAG TPA: hypothetical protein EYG46_14690 [Myxococcales bacterium]|nr:hypothetical protein [Myxococcales bacterium]HIM02230.1 hypothetical protein [Myxococcales bacterium]
MAIFLLILVAPATVQQYAPLGLLPLLVLVTGIPHYGATLQRVYARREDFTKYRLLAVWASLVIYAWFIVGVYEATLGSWLVTLYLTWSPWHYTGQNYGVALMLFGRRHGEIPVTTKRVLYASFVLSYAIAFLGIHGASGTQTYVAEANYQLIRLGIPQAVYDLVLPILVTSYLVTSGIALLRLGRGRSIGDLAPVVGLILLQATWFCIPVLARSGAIPGWSTDPQLEIYSMMWVGIGHSVQYLWVTTYYANAADPGNSAYKHLGWALLAGGAAWGIPAFVFAPDALGVRAFDYGLGILVAAAVNVHHFVLDGAIWKLRDGRIARILLVKASEQATPTLMSPRHSVSARVAATLVALAGIAYVLVSIVGTLEVEFGVRRASSPPNYSRMRTAANRLRWIGRDNPGLRYDLGLAAFANGDLEVAERELRRSVSLNNDPAVWVGLGMVAERGARWQSALDSYDAALAADESNLAALTRSARLLQRSGRTERAIRYLERATTLAPENKNLRNWLEELESG